MRYYPVMLDIRDQPVCVVGGGSVALRKARSLRKAGSRVRVVAPVLCAGMAAFVRLPGVVWDKRRYHTGMLKDARLVIAATDDPGVNSLISADAQRAAVPVNVVDVPALSDFIVPSVLEKDGFMLAVSTSGKAPSFARMVRLDLAKDIFPRYARQAKALASARVRVRNAVSSFGVRKAVLAQLCRLAGRGNACPRAVIDRVIAQKSKRNT